MPFSGPVQVVDSHTEGEPTRVVLAGAPDLGSGSLHEKLHRLRTEFDGFRTGVLCEPRGSDVVVGALLLEPESPASAAAVIFFNDVGYLGMCGHGTIGLVATLAHLGRIQPGPHQIETVVGTVSAVLHQDGSVTVANVPSFRYRANILVEVPNLGTVQGDIAWGGNWFFLVPNPPCDLFLRNRAELLSASTAVRIALLDQSITGPNGDHIDHIEFFSAPHNPANSSRNFVLCPGAAFDRSPCGTGTSAKLACLAADGKLAPGATWRQEGMLGTVFEGSYTPATDGQIHPKIRGRAWITAESTLHFASSDPFREGIPF
jgi:4-hydroxyproline epimerase